MPVTLLRPHEKKFWEMSSPLHRYQEILAREQVQTHMSIMKKVTFYLTAHRILGRASFIAIIILSVHMILSLPYSSPFKISFVLYSTDQLTVYLPPNYTYLCLCLRPITENSQSKQNIEKNSCDIPITRGNNVITGNSLSIA